MRKKNLKFVLLVHTELKSKGAHAQVVVKSVKAKPLAISLPIEAVHLKREAKLRVTS